MNEGRRETTDSCDSDPDGISDWLSHMIYWLILMALIHVSNMSYPLSDIVHEQGLDGREYHAVSIFGVVQTKLFHEGV